MIYGEMFSTPVRVGKIHFHYGDVYKQQPFPEFEARSVSVNDTVCTEKLDDNIETAWLAATRSNDVERVHDFLRQHTEWSVNHVFHEGGQTGVSTVSHAIRVDP
jgi:hypothetical protein